MTYKVRCGGKTDPNMKELFQETGCKREFILKKLDISDKDKEFRLPSESSLASNESLPVSSKLCKICTCCSNHFEQHKCEAENKDDLILKILGI